MFAPCLEPGCPRPAATRGRCARHADAHDRAVDRAGRHVYRTKRWRLTRRAYLLAHPLCDHCGHIATDVHHRTDLRDGGHPWAHANLQGLCHSHHSRVTRARQLEAA